MKDFFKQWETEFLKFIDSQNLAPFYEFMDQTLQQDLEDCKRAQQFLGQFLAPLFKAANEFRKK